MPEKPTSPFLLLLYFLILALLPTCGGGGGGGEVVATPPSTGSVTSSISDPPTCLVPNGSFLNAWITITMVRAHVSANAGPNDSGWITLVDLRSNPVQIDLLNLPASACPPVQLGISNNVPPGQYQQIRLHLLSNNPGSGAATPAANHCASNGFNGFNCVGTPEGTEPLLIGSEAQNGIRIPAEQISGGGFKVVAGQSQNLNIDFNLCASLVQQGNGAFRLKPVIHAGLIAPNNNFISGVVVDSLSNTPIAGAMVFAEQPDPDNPLIDRVVVQTTTGSLGDFSLCPLPAGNYDLVVDARTMFFVYQPTVTLQVPQGTVMGNIPLVPQASPLPATVTGNITSSTAAGIPITVDVNISALQPIGTSLLVTIPPFQSSSPAQDSISSVTTENGRAAYQLVLPAGNPRFGTFSASPPTDYSGPLSGPAAYQINAQAFIPMNIPANSSLNAGAPDCTPSSLPSTISGTTQLSVTPGASLTRDFVFNQCQ